MKKILIMICVMSFNFYVIYLKEKLIEAAKDKENQEKAKEIAKQGIEYIKEKAASKEEVKADPAPVASPAVKKAIVKKKAKKK